MSAEDSFQIRVKNAVKGNYQSAMRRSLQSIALYEADRCLKFRYPQLRPFQRKFALFATAVDLLKTLDFLNDYHRQEVMFRTNASKEPLAPDLAWRRMKLISREINQTILPKAKELIENDDNSGKSHDEICELLLQGMYEESNENSNKRNPPMWEFNHNNVFTVYRIYYRGLAIDPNLFPAMPPRLVEVPLKKHANFHLAPGHGDSAPFFSLANMTIGSGKRRNNGEMSEEERREMLKEVKDHTELLKEFEGVIPDAELIGRKRALYAALPPVPPPAGGAGGAVGAAWAGGAGGGKRQKKKAHVLAAATAATAAAAAIPEATKPTAMEEDDWDKVNVDEKEVKPADSFAAV